MIKRRDKAIFPLISFKDRERLKLQNKKSIKEVLKNHPNLQDFQEGNPENVSTTHSFSDSIDLILDIETFGKVESLK